MTKADEPRFLTLLEALGAVFRVEVTPALLEGYWLALSDLPLDDIQVAVTRGMRTGKFMPTPAELRRLSGEVPIETRAAIAWQAVRTALRRHGTSHGVDFQDGGITNAAVRRIGGWCQRLGLMETDEVPFVQKEFERAYRDVAEHGTEGEQRTPLPGLYQLSEVVRVPIVFDPARAIEGLKP